MPSSAGTTILASRYARALLDVALDKKDDVDKVEKDLDEVAAVLEEHDALADALSTPAIAADKRVAICDDVFGKRKLAGSSHSILRLLVERERMPILRNIVDQFRLLVQEHKKVQPGVVTSARPLNAKQQKQLSQSLGDALSKTMELSYEVDSKLVGGIVVRIGNRVYDASVITQLQRFKDKALSSL